MHSNIYILAACLVLLACMSTNSSEPINENASARQRFTLPRLFDFARYQQIFQKSYNSLVEEIARQKLFLARVFQVVISMVRYKHNILDFHLSVNHMSDLSPDELKRRKTTAEQLHFERRFSRGEKKSEDEEVHVAAEDEIEQVVEEVIQHKNEPGYREIAYEFESAQEAIGQVRKRRGATSDHRRHISMDDLIHPMKQDPPKRKASIPSNNPAYEPPELTSFGGNMPVPQPPLSPGFMDTISKIPGVGFLISMVQSTSDELAEKEESMEKEESTVMPDSMFIDHRESDCFMQVRDQGNCGACWAFSTISMFEWMLCNQTGIKEAFSEQYMIDCSKDEYELAGCNGGIDDLAADFTFKYGLQLRKNYPYLEADDECPYEGAEDMKKASYIKLKDTKYEQVRMRYIEKAIRRRPILLGLMLNDEFLSYGGGVHTIDDCSIEYGHMMLMVGHGRQDGKEFFLFRNSHSSSWGEEGYYKLDKKSFELCVATKFGGELKGSF